MRPIIAISMGDYNGIGPEVTLKALDKMDINSSIAIWIGFKEIFDSTRQLIGAGKTARIIHTVGDAKPGQINILNINGGHSNSPDIQFGTVSELSGKGSMDAVERGINLCLNHQCDALVTAPISKEAIHMAGYRIPGHTEFLMEKAEVNKVMMILTSSDLKIAPSTIHIPIKDIPKNISIEKLLDQIKMLFESLNSDFGVEYPAIALLGLNPHSGDGGVIGTEEIDIIIPAIEQAKKRGFHVVGPFPADGYFASKQYRNFDITLSMYHDQGLIPFKMISFGKGVNFTAGLPFIRTSPDHGTAFDIAGKNIADESSFVSAYELAVHLSKNRKRS